MTPDQHSKRLLLLHANTHDHSLRLHPLKGRLKGLHSVSVNRPYRITLELIVQDKRIVPVNIGDHDTVY